MSSRNGEPEMFTWDVDCGQDTGNIREGANTHVSEMSDSERIVSMREVPGC